MSHHFRVHEQLSRVELDALESFCREPGRTVDEVVERLAAGGHALSRGAVWRWKREFDLTDRFHASSETARALMDAAKSGGAVAISDAATLRLSQILFEQLVSMDADPEAEIDTKQLWQISMALRNSIGSVGAVRKMLAEKFETETKKLLGSRREITDQDIADVRKAVFG
jgi:hypothetical protein